MSDIWSRLNSQSIQRAANLTTPNHCLLPLQRHILASFTLTHTDVCKYNVTASFTPVTPSGSPIHEQHTARPDAIGLAGRLPTAPVCATSGVGLGVGR